MPATTSTLRRLTRAPRRSRLLPTSTRHVAITGGIGAGKSAALEAFARHGAATISSDEIVHRLLRDDEDVRRELVARFGQDVMGDDGADRSKIAAIVFNDAEALDWLEKLLHPRVVAEGLSWRENQEAPLTVTEIPLLYETGAERRFDAVVVITAPEGVRRERRSLADDREQRLLPDDEKAARADYVYVNDGTLEDLDAFVADVVGKILK